MDEPRRDQIQDLEATITEAAIELAEIDPNARMRVELALAKAFEIATRISALAG